MQKKTIGNQGESFIATYLQQLGWHIIHRNWRCAAGELDIVAWEGDTLVFVEVRTRSGNKSVIQQALESVDEKKKARLAMLAEQYLEQEIVPASTWTRVDVFGVAAQENGVFQMEHVRDVLQW